MTCKLRHFMLLLLMACLVCGSPLAAFAADDPIDWEERYDELYETYQRSFQEDVLQPSPTPTPLPKNPKIKLTNPSVYITKPGATDVIELTVKNVGSSHAENILTQAQLPADAPFIVEFLNKSNMISTLYDGSSATEKLQIKVDANAKEGNYIITLNHSFKNMENVNSEETDTLTVRIASAGATSAPGVALYNFTPSVDAVKPGAAFTLAATLENTSNDVLKDVRVTVEGFKAGEINMTGSGGNVYFKELSKGQSQALSYSLSAGDKIPAGTYVLTFKVAYKDKEGKAYEDSFSYYINVGGQASGGAQLEIHNLVTPVGTFGVGQEFSVSFNLVNRGQTEAKNVKITAASQTAEAIVPKSASVKTFQTLDVGQSQPVSFTFAGTNASKSQNYAIGFTVDYETGGQGAESAPETASFSQYVGVNLSNPEADKEEEEDDKDKKSIPKIIVSRYESDPIIVTAAQNFHLSVTLQNTHPTKTIENVKAYLTSVEEGIEDNKGSVFVPVDSSNTFYIQSIGPKQEVSQDFTFYTIPDAKAMTYIVTINFEYQDSELNEYASKEQVGITVKQTSKLETYNLTTPQDAMIGMPATLYFDFYNAGKVTLRNLKMELTGDFDKENPVTYFSNFAPGNTNAYEGTIYPTTAGPQQGEVLISYEDESGEKMNEKIAFEFNAMDMPAMDPGMNGMMPMEPQGPRIPWLYIGISGGVAAIVVIALVVRHRKKKRIESLDADE